MIYAFGNQPMLFLKTVMIYGKHNQSIIRQAKLVQWINILLMY